MKGRSEIASDCQRLPLAPYNCCRVAPGLHRVCAEHVIAYIQVSMRDSAGVAACCPNVTGPAQTVAGETIVRATDGILRPGERAARS